MRSLLITAKKVFSRGLPVAIASTFLHVGIAAALVVGTGGHRPTTPSTLLLEVDVTGIEPTPVPVSEKEEEEEEAKATPAAAHPAPPTHTHPYDVPPSHDAHPHDPSMVHDSDHHATIDHASPPAEPAPVLASPDVAPSSMMPRFTIALGNGKPASGTSVAMGAIGTGGGTSTSNVAPSIPAAAFSPPSMIVPESTVSMPAKLVSSVIAAYPVDARQNEMEADVPVEIVVDAHGTVTEARIVRAAGSGFDESALVAIKRYRFTPAQRDGRVVSVRMRWSVQFRLR